MRGYARNPLQKLIDAAVRASLRAGRDRGLLTDTIGASAPPQTITTEGETDDGVVYTIHPFMLNHDALNAPGAALHVEGHFKDYGS